MFGKKKFNCDRAVPTYSDCIAAIEMFRKEMSDKVADRLIGIVQKAQAQTQTHWAVVKTDAGKLRYKCSTCGHVTTVPTRCCTECGSNKLDANGVVSKIQMQ
jgi:hypothetical protein